MKVLRVTFYRKVEQKAVHDFNLSNEDYEKLKTGEIKSEEIMKNEIGEDFSYTSVGWIETGAEPPKVDYEIGSWNTE
jgi:hypothetical protein